MTAPLPEIEGKYEILEKLQVGGMGAIYKVRHRLLGDLRVVKVMRPQLMGDPALRQRFHREAKAATRLIHPNIARLYDFSVDDEGSAYIVMEFIEGWTLDDLVTRGELPPVGLALEIAAQGLAAIGHLHANGVVHRDISPDNLMLTEDVDGRPAIKLIDLGLVKSTAASGDLTATGVFLGKFRYASPEQFGRRDETPVGPYSDLYSFGVVLYELLTGHYPITGESPPALIAGHLFRPPLDFAATDPERRVPDDLRQVVLRSLAKHPDERFASAGAFTAALEPVRRRHALDTPETRRLLELIRQPPSGERRRPSKPGSTQSRFDRQFGPGTGGEPGDAVSAVRWIESKIAEGDLEAARDGLRESLETEGDLPVLLELDQRIAEIEQIALREREAPASPPPAPPPPSSRRPAEDLREILAAEAGPRAADAETTLLEVTEDEAAIAETTLLPTQPRRPAEAADDAAAVAVTDILPTVPAAPIQSAPETRPLETHPHVVPPSPPAVPAPPPRGFDEISLKTIPQQPRAAPAKTEVSLLDEMPLASRPDEEGGEVWQEPSRGEPPGSRPSNRMLFVAALITVSVLALLIGVGLSRLRPGEAEQGALEVEGFGQAQPSTRARELLADLGSRPSPALTQVAEAFVAADYEETLSRAAAGSFSQPREEAWARLLRAAARYALYELGSGTDAAALEGAREEVRACRALDASVEPVGDSFSPRFREFFAATQ